MSGSSVPGPLTRLLRNRLATIAVVTLAVFAAGSGYMRDTASVELQGTIDANWRGAFDLLVRPAEQRLALEETQGLIEPNYVTFTGDGGITLDDLLAIRAVPGVDVAAPIAMIGNMRYVVGGPVVARGDLPEQPTLYRLTVRAETSDGVDQVLVQQETVQLLLGPEGSGPTGFPLVTDADSISCCEGGLFLYLTPLPPISSPIIGVDPEAERQLLGDSAAFLDPLAEVASLASAPVAREFDVDRIAEEFDDQRFMVSLLTADPMSPAADRPVIPVAVSSTIYAPLTVTLEVEQVGEALPQFPAGENDAEQLQRARELAGSEAKVIGTSVLSASETLRPFQPPALMVVWPETEEPRDSASTVGVAADLNAELIGRPDYEAARPRDAAGVPTFRVQAEGWVDSSGTSQEPGPSDAAVQVGVEPAFRPGRPAPLPLLTDFVPTSDLDRPFVFAPVSSFDLEALELPDNPLNYVPLGAYAAPETWYVAGSGSEVAERTRMTPTLNPRGLINLPPLALTDLRSAELLRGEAPIDAVRVRINGIDRFGDASLRQIQRVAGAIEEMGLQVDIVAGSSPQTVEVTTSQPLGTGTSSPRRWIEQPWTTLGAAERVVIGFSSANAGLLTLSALTAVTLAGGMIVLQRGVRRVEMGVLRALGWSRARIAGWVLGEALWSASIVLAVGLAAWWAAGRTSGIGLATSVALALVFPLVAVVSAWAGLRAAATPSAIRGGDMDATLARIVRQVRTPSTYGLRSAVARPLRVLVIALAVGVAAGAATAAVTVVGGTAAAVGPTRLAGALVALLSPSQIGMLIIAIAASTVLGMTLLRMDMRSREEEMRVLSACGWRRTDRRMMLATHRLAIGVPAAGVAAMLGWVLVNSVLGVGDPVAAAMASAIVLAGLQLDARWSA